MKRKKNILVITYWSFENALIQTYALPYVKQIRNNLCGGKIYLFCLSQQKEYSAAVKKQIAELKKENIELLSFSYGRFGLGMAVKLAFIIKYLIVFSVFKRINTIHAWCTPGGAIGYLISVITRKKLVLDSFEPHAETMVEGNTWKKDSIAYKLLFWLEGRQLKRASEVICATSGMIEHSKQVYGISKNRYFVKPACVNFNLFNPGLNTEELKRALQLKDVVCVYPGKFGGIYLEQEVFDFFKTAFDYWKGNFSVLLLTSHTDAEILEYARRAGLPAEAIVKKFVPHQEVPKYMALATFGLCPVKPLPSKAYCTPIKNGEFWAMGLPVVITRNISDDSRIISENEAGYELQDLNQEEYLKAVGAIQSVINTPGYSQRIKNLAVTYRDFSIAEEIYKTIYA